MKTNNFIIIIFLTAFSSASCNQSPPSPSDCMVLDEVKYVTEFPQTFSLQDKIETTIDIIGIKSFAIYDSLMILSTTNEDGLWSFISLPDHKYLGNFLTKGEGPFEFISSPSINDKMKIYKEDSSLFASIYDSQKGKKYKMNISESLNNNKLSITESKDFLPPFLFNMVMIDSVNLLCKEVNDNQTQQIRYLYRAQNKITPPLLQKLNQAKIKEHEDINILSTIAKHSPEKNLIVEMPIGLNYLNVYSQDLTWGKTICVGNILEDIAKIQEKDRWDRIYTFADLRLFTDFFGVLYINEDEKTYQTGRKRLPSILLFDWQGEPLAELKMNHFITSFDIDFKNATLYTLDVHTDEFSKYNIKNVLEEISNK